MSLRARTRGDMSQRRDKIMRWSHNSTSSRGVQRGHVAATELQCVHTQENVAEHDPENCAASRPRCGLAAHGACS